MVWVLAWRTLSQEGSSSNKELSVPPLFCLYALRLAAQRLRLGYTGTAKCKRACRSGCRCRMVQCVVRHVVDGRLAVLCVLQMQQ
jgi:hypothetical protein